MCNSATSGSDGELQKGERICIIKKQIWIMIMISEKKKKKNSKVPWSAFSSEGGLSSNSS
jgi:hypothetical protein